MNTTSEKCPYHNPDCPKCNKTPTPEWQKKFDDRFLITHCESNYCRICMEDKIKKENIKSFISSLLLSERQKLVEVVRGMKVPFCRLECGSGHELKARVLSLLESRIEQK